MWSSLVNYFYSKPPDDSDLSEKDAYNILDVAEPESSPKKEEDTLQENHCKRNLGIITDYQPPNTYTIDDSETFEFTQGKLPVGTKISYDICSFEGITNITNIRVVDDWDHHVTTNQQLCYNRTVVGQIIGKNGRILELSFRNLTIDMDKIGLEFLPIVGDWVEMEVVCKADESIENLFGDILFISQIVPLRVHILSGTVTTWNPNEFHGTIDRTIYFNRTALCLGYQPKRGDKVTVEVMESTQNACNLRALKMSPDRMNRFIENSLNNVSLENYITEHSCLVAQNTDVKMEKLNYVKRWNLELINTSQEQFHVKKVAFKDDVSQCRLVEAVEEITLKNGSLTIPCECTARNIGTSRELLQVHFTDFVFSIWINIHVQIQANNYRKYVAPEIKTNLISGENFQRIKGPVVGRIIRFRLVQLPDYRPPEHLFELIQPNSKSIDYTDELHKLKPVIFSNLTFQNYENKFHNLLHLEEAVTMSHSHKFSQERACFIRNNEFMMLEMPNLSESKPSVTVGDRVFARKFGVKSGVEYESFVHKVGSQHVFLKFSPVFHNSYDNEDYTIRVQFSRTMFRRSHNAINGAVKNLGAELLFPRRVTERAAQVNLPEISINQSPNDRKRLKPIDALKIMEAHKSNSEIQWHNQSLNCFQKEAIRNILLGVARPLPYIIFGPPGTGKTVTVVETILQLLKFVPSGRFLICAPSNSATNLIALRLIDSGVLRPGDLVRLVSLNYLSIIDSIPDKLLPYCALVSPAKPDTDSASMLHSNGTTVEFNLESLGRHKITVTTCGCAGGLLTAGVGRGHFSHVIVDEAGQTSEPEVMCPLMLSDTSSGQIILAGDPQQLGPVTLSDLAGDNGLKESYLDRLFSRFPYTCDYESFPKTNGFDPRLVTKLLYNYRALPPLLKLTSSLFYNNELIPSVSMKESPEIELLKRLKEILPTRPDNQLPAIVFHGVQGENCQSDDSPSWFNPHEAAQIFYYVNELYRMGLKGDDLGVITPYTKQVKEIRRIFNEAEFEVPKIGTVEDFQGQEFNVVLVSTVRSNDQLISYDVQHFLGFVSSPRRINVAVSRAKSLLIIVGNPRLLSTDIYWRTVLEYCLENGAYTGCDLD